MQAELIRRSCSRATPPSWSTTAGPRSTRPGSRRPDLVVLDVMMPRVDGFGVCRVLRQDDDMPVLMLTARSTEDDVLLGLDLGADDYMTKPYSPRELMARVRTVLRRATAPPRASPTRSLRAARIAVDPVRHEVTCDGTPVDCTPGEFAHPPRHGRRARTGLHPPQLLEHTRGIDRASTERAVDVHIMNLRKKIEPDPRRPVRLLTVFGVGYKLSGRPPMTPSPRIPLRKSLLVRLLIASVLIAVVSVAATAWLAVGTTTRAIQEEQGQVLTDDTDILRQLSGYAATHPTGPASQTWCARCRQDRAGASP